MNQKVGESNEGCEGITGKHGTGTINDNGDRLVRFAAFNNLIITGTIFPHRMLRNQIDHVLLSRQHRTLVLDTRAMRGADVASDHHLEVKTRRWKWIGHVLRMERNSHCRTALTWQPEGKRRPGRLRTTWRRTVEHERKEMGIASWEVARNIGMYRSC